MKTTRKFLALILLAGALPLATAPASAEVEGVVTSARGIPVEHARVEVVDTEGAGGGADYTDANGRFRLPGVEAPVELVVTHPRFKLGSASVGVGASGAVEILLEAKQKIFEEIAVSASPGERGYAPVSVAAHVVKPEDSAAPSTLTEIVAEVPAVAENGQGGIFQTYSVRGVSRQRVLTLVEGMRIVSERRAGTSASFVEPGLMRSVDVLKGPSSTYYGSGALGGVVQLFPREFERLAVIAGYESQGDARRLVVGRGGRSWSFGLARREAGDAETPSGDVLNSGFTQTSASFVRRWDAGDLSYRLTALGSLGDEIGKANTDFPDRTTVYPDERHLLLRLAIERPDRWKFDVWAHPNSLDTRVTAESEESGESEESDESLVENSAFDLGLNWQARRSNGDGGSSSVSWRYGADYFGRRSVDAVETAVDPIQTTVQRTLDGGREDEFGLYGALEWSWKKAVVLAGGRAAFQKQGNSGADSREDEALTGFAGLVLPLAQGFELVANLGTGLRFASLSERFFTGSTGRGFVVGNPDLDPEDSLNADVGLRWFGSRLFLAGYVFRNDIDDYIERVEVEPGLLTFVNLTSGGVEGVELDGAYRLGADWSLSFGGHAIEGRDDAGGPLADIPADRTFLGVEGNRGAWSWRGRWEHRGEKNDPGSGEKVISSADLLSATLSRSLGDGIELTLSGRNLLDEDYFNSADRRVPLAPGRSIGVTLAWTAGSE